MLESSKNYETFKITNKNKMLDENTPKYENLNITTTTTTITDENDTNTTIDNSSYSDFREKKKKKYKWLILSLCCTVITTLYYSFDIATVLHQQLKDYIPSQNFEYKYNLLFVSYSLPNTILPILGGTLIEKTTASQCIILFSFLCWLGHVIFSIGLYSKNWFVIYLGRLIYGLGGENLFVAQSTIIAQWFDTKDVALAFGISSSISWLGGVLNDWVTPVIANKISIFFALFIGGIVLLFGVFSALGIWYIDEWIVLTGDMDWKRKTYDFIDSVVIHDGDAIHDVMEHFDDEYDENDKNELHEENESHDTTDQNTQISTKEHTKDEMQSIQMEQPSSPKFTSLFWTICICYIFVEGSILVFDNLASGILMERSYFIIDDSNLCHLPNDNECTFGTLQSSGVNDYIVSYKDEDQGLCKDIDNNPNIAPILPKSLNITNITNGWKSSYTYKQINPRKDINCNDPFWSKSCTNNYCIQQNIATERVGRAMSIPYIISSILVPLLGHISDRCTTITCCKTFSCLGLYLLLAPLILFIVHCTLAFSPISPIIPLVGQGIACALYTSAIWPSIPKSIPKSNNRKNIGLAYGIITSLLNVSLVIFPITTSYIYTNISNDSYIPNVEIFFVVCAFIGVIAGVVLNFGIKNSHYYLSS